MLYLRKGTGETSSLGLDLDGSWQDFLQKQNLSERLQDLITYSICLWDWSLNQKDFPQLSCKAALERLGSFISSLGLYGRGTSMPLLYPMYGIAEVAQGFTRLCAVHRGIYALRTNATHLIADQEERLCGLRTQRGEMINTQCVVAACGELLEDQATSSSSSQQCRRMTALFTQPPLGEDGVSLCVVPPDALGTPALQNVVQVLQLDYSSGVCPHGYFVAHLSQSFVSDTDESSFSDLDRVLDELMKRCPVDTKCIFRCRYLHIPRSTKRWNDATAAGSFMQRCCESGQLSMVGDPPVMPQLLAAQEISEARKIFQKSAVEGAEFLPKPQHVAEEEMSGAMEELEHFNEQMQVPPENMPVLMPEATEDAAS
eukprot:symbB.v1.2.027469.t1/scaffold2822.1/size98038/4